MYNTLKQIVTSFGFPYTACVRVSVGRTARATVAGIDAFACCRLVLGRS